MAAPGRDAPVLGLKPVAAAEMDIARLRPASCGASLPELLDGRGALSRRLVAIRAVATSVRRIACIEIPLTRGVLRPSVRFAHG